MYGLNEAFAAFVKALKAERLGKVSGISVWKWVMENPASLHVLS